MRIILVIMPSVLIPQVRLSSSLYSLRWFVIAILAALLFFFTLFSSGSAAA